MSTKNNANHPMQDPEGMVKNKAEGTKALTYTIGDGSDNYTQEEIVANEKTGWSEGPMWEAYQAIRPYNLEGHVPRAPKSGDKAPDGAVVTLDGKPTTLLAQADALGKLTGSSLVAISFDSVTCPVWTMFAGQDFHKAAADNGVPVLHCYILEAHPDDAFSVDPFGLPTYMRLKERQNTHMTIEERVKAARNAKTVLESQVGGTVTMVVDTMSDEIDLAYEARPFRLCIYNRDSGKIVEAMAPCPFNIDAKVENIKKFIQAQK
jgi:hypothetical protein